MAFNLFNSFIMWLKKIFHIRLKKVEPAEEEPKEVSPEGEKTAKAPPEEAKTDEEKDTLKRQKPYKKKTPTEENKRKLIKSSTTERKLSTLKQRKTIYPGDTQRRRRRLTGAQRKSQSDEDIDKETTDKTLEEKFATTVESPFIEINLDDGNVYLILPQQQFKTKTVDQTPYQINYVLDLDEKHQKVPVKITTDKSGLMFMEEKRILLEEPLAKFQAAFPDEIQGRKYNYNHKDKELYAFVAIGNNRGRMCYLYNKKGNINPLPKRDVWILLNRDFELQTEPDVIEEKWIWERYRPFRVDLSETDALIIRNRKSDEEKSFTLQSTFYVEGEQLVEDDFKKECPFFTGRALKIVAPYENQSGWNVWILHKAVSAKMVSQNWMGNEPLILNCPEDLPCDCGEFQVDICQQDTRIPDETLFFRLMPPVELNFPKELIIPNSKLGHTHLAVGVKVNGEDEWELGYEKDSEVKVKLRQRNFYNIELSPERDTFRFFIVRTSRPEFFVNLQITIPRLKWKTSKQKIWSSISQKIERKDLKTGKPFYLLVRTNVFDTKYELLALLETDGNKLQEGKFIRKGTEYSLELNQFYDTIRQCKNKSNLRVEICEVKNYQLLGEVDILNFAAPFICCKVTSCGFETHSIEDMMSHFEKEHFSNLIEHLTYEELKEYDEMLPHSIYKCSYCGFYSREDDPQSPTSLIEQHIEHCSKADRGGGSTHIKFHVITDIDEIRQKVIPGLSRIYKCKLCGIHFKDYSKKAQLEHFFKRHGNEIFECLGGSNYAT